MSILSEITIILKQSQDALKLTFLLYIFSMSLVIYSSFPIYGKITLIALLLIILYLSYNNLIFKTQHIQSIHYNKEVWLIKDLYGDELCYNTVKLYFNGGLFVILEFINRDSTRFILLFYDQMNNEDLKTLIIKSNASKI